MDREPVQTDNAPKAIGPYQQAIKANGFIYTAGRIPIDPKTGNFVEGDITAPDPASAGESQSGLGSRGDHPSTASSKRPSF